MMTLVKLRDYILRKLGSPVINIEIDESQVDDCIQEAVDKFIESHYDGTDVSYIEHAIIKDQTVYTLASNVQSVSDILLASNVFINDEPLLLTRPFLAGGYDVNPNIDLASVEIYRQNIENIENYFRKDTLYDYNSTTKKLKLAVPPTENDTAFLKVFQSELDSSEIYDNHWLKKYAVALSKIQWGQNISKYSGATLPGGVTLNGDAIKSDGKEEKDVLDLELQEMYSDPPDMFVG